MSLTSRVYRPDAYHALRPWGPFIDPETYVIQVTTYTDLIVGGIVFSLAMSLAVLAAWLAIKQTRASREPLKNAYVIMIWVELAANVTLALQCFLYLLYVIRPSFYFYLSILIVWAIQLHLLLQIIINRIRVILQDRKKGKRIVIGVAVFILLINISVFNIWLPARMQISQRYIAVNNVWDRIEKVIYLLVDGALNYYFIRVVRATLVANGLQKYMRLVRFNQRIILVSLAMDVMIIGAMSIPNGFVYAIFHPLAFNVKLNIEMTMANLIRTIALNTPTSDPFPQPNSTSTASTAPSAKSKYLSALLTPYAPPRDDADVDAEGIMVTEEWDVVSRRRSQMQGLGTGERRVDSLGAEEKGVEMGMLSSPSRSGVSDPGAELQRPVPAAVRM